MSADKFPFAVRLIGFAEAQEEALAAALKRAPHHGPAYFFLPGDSLQEPDLLIANGAELKSLAVLAALNPGDVRPALLLGAPQAGPEQGAGLLTALPYPSLPMPCDDDSLHAELARLVERRAEALARLAGAGLPPLAERRARERLDFDLTDPSEYAAMRTTGQDRRGAVLVVDRNARFSQHVAKLLKPWAIPALWASDEPSALAACADAPQMLAPVAVVLINTSLAEIDPYLLCAALREQAGADVRAPDVVLLVSRDYAYDSARARAAGAAGLLNKPVSDPTLRAAIKRLMRIA
ncbi:response regulator [Pseudoduganella aquatica]|uniref:Response regulator n=1 Tax=Pseudoduganella aquatica TaxID=2660641 RepID=A0A7X4HD87_9BURK|nr:response regulator [Pseudoduganella aquatica]MYN08452.1 response regulator [Pseudoduganella aquatica]